VAKAHRDPLLNAREIELSVVQATKRVWREKMVGTAQNFDAVVVGAGFSGMYMLKALRDSWG
jgi:hypothetical protein